MTNNTIIKRQQKEKLALIENLKQVPIVQVAANKSGIGRATYYRWRQQDKEFAKLADESLAEGISMINDMSESQIISAIKDGNLTAAFYWLNHRHVAYGNKVEVTTGLKEADETLTPEQQETVRKALALSGLTEKDQKEEEK